MKSGRWILAVLAGLTMATSGCKTLEEYRQLEFQNRALANEKVQLESELYDCRTNSESLRSRLAGAEARLLDKDRLVTNLQSENDQLEKAFALCQKTVEDMANRNMGDVVVQALPQELDAALRSFARQYPDVVDYDANSGTVKWKSDLLFAFSSDVVKESARNSLSSFARIMTSPAAEGFDILIVGHTDDRPITNQATLQRHPDNWHLSVHRAISVCREMIKDGISPKKIGVAGFGEYRPVIPGPSQPRVGEPRNRRVEIYVVPAGSIGGVAASDVIPADEPAPVMDDGIK